MFNKHFINIVAKKSGIAPTTLGNPLDPKDENNIREKPIFDFPEATT